MDGRLVGCNKCWGAATTWRKPTASRLAHATPRTRAGASAAAIEGGGAPAPRVLHGRARARRDRRLDPGASRPAHPIGRIIAWLADDDVIEERLSSGRLLQPNAPAQLQGQLRQDTERLNRDADGRHDPPNGRHLSAAARVRPASCSALVWCSAQAASIRCVWPGTLARWPVGASASRRVRPYTTQRLRRDGWRLRGAADRGARGPVRAARRWWPA